MAHPAAFAWYVIHRESRFVLAGFVEFEHAARIAALHELYVVVAHCEL